MKKMRFVMFAAAAVAFGAVSLPSSAEARSCGKASWYSLPGNKTANGERMNPGAMTAAHRSLPFGTRVRVDNLRNGRSVVVRINDRGPFTGGRIIDLSKGAASQIGMIGSGTASVRVTPIGRGGGVAMANAGGGVFGGKKRGGGRC
jgi:rare lipoprotein A